MSRRSVFSIQAQPGLAETESTLSILVIVLSDSLFVECLLVILPEIAFKVNYHYLYTDRMQRDRRND